MSSNNGEKIKGGLQSTGGKVKEVIGNIVNNPELANEGRAEQVVGNERVEDAQAAERVKGAGEQIQGKIKSVVGDISNDPALEAEGEADRLRGKAREQTNK
jgi:uncharacterized protein YjbJ (UPF0337 family)